MQLLSTPILKAIIKLIQKHFLILILLQSNFGFCQQADLFGISYSNYRFNKVNVDNMTDGYALNKHYNGFEINYCHINKNPIVAFSNSIVYSPFNFIHWQSYDPRSGGPPQNQPVTHLGYQYEIKSQNLIISSYVMLKTKNNFFNVFISAGLEFESSLHSTSKIYDYSSYQHLDSISNNYIFDSTGYRFIEKTSSKFNGNGVSVGMQTGFMTNFNTNIFLFGTIGIKKYTGSSLLPLISSCGIFSYKLGLYYRIPSKEKPKPVPG